MKCSKLMLVSFCWIFVFSSFAFTQSKTTKERIKNLGISPIEFYPKLKTEYYIASEIKTISRKQVYRLGELISIDVAILNNFSESVYSLNLEQFAQIQIQDAKKEVVPLRSFGTVDFLLSSKNYVFLKTGQFNSAHFLFVLGCENKIGQLPYTSLQNVFEDNAFSNKGRGCIDFPKTGSYYIKTKIINPFVVITKPTAKTLIGEMESLPFKIEIIE